MEDVEMADEQLDQMGSEKKEGKAKSGKANWASLSRNLKKTAVKQLDQLSPLKIRLLPPFAAVIVGVVFVGSFFGAAIYNGIELFGKCSQENSCLTCSIQLSSSSQSGGSVQCTDLAIPKLDVTAGCMSVSIPNNFESIRSLIAMMREQESNCPDWASSRFCESFTNHGYAVSKMIRGNSINQMIDPDPQVVRNFLASFYVGFENDFQYGYIWYEDDALKKAGIQLIYSYITTACALWTAQAEGEIKKFSKQRTFYENGRKITTNFTVFALAAFYCGDFSGTPEPSSQVPAGRWLNNGLSFQLVGIPDNYVQNIPMEIWCDRGNNNTGTRFPLNITCYNAKWQNTGDDDYARWHPDGNDYRACLPPEEDCVDGNVSVALNHEFAAYEADVLEMLDFNSLWLYPDCLIKVGLGKMSNIEGADGIMISPPIEGDGDNCDDSLVSLSHCSQSVLTSAPATLVSVFSECCAEQTLPNKISNIYAFAGFISSLAMIGITILFWKLQHQEATTKYEPSDSGESSEGGDS